VKAELSIGAKRGCKGGLSWKSGDIEKKKDPPWGMGKCSEG